MVSVAELTVPGRTTVMGIVNVTEDSFSVGGESTRPGATRVPAEVEAARIRPVIEALHADGIRTSIDTMRATTAAVAAEAGVDLINDVSGGLADEDMYRVMAETKLPVCLMHWRADAFVNASGAADHGGDVVRDVHEVLDQLVDNALAAGVAHDQITLDPGLGFAKTAADNWALLNALPEFIAGEFPVLVGASRKRFLTGIREDRGLEHGPVDADPATAAVTALSAHYGAWCVRVHEVAVSRDAVDVAARWRQGGGN